MMVVRTYKKKIGELLDAKHKSILFRQFALL